MDKKGLKNLKDIFLKLRNDYKEETFDEAFSIIVYYCPSDYGLGVFKEGEESCLWPDCFKCWKQALWLNIADMCENARYSYILEELINELGGHKSIEIRV